MGADCCVHDRHGNGEVRVSNAFTIVELLSAIGVIAVLLAILLPALSRSRTRAAEFANIARLKQHVAAFASYNLDYDDFMPYYTSSDGPVTLRWERISWELPQYFCGANVWNMVLGPSYLGVGPDHEVFYPIGYIQEHFSSFGVRPFMTPFHFTRVYLADSVYWQNGVDRGWNEHWVQLRAGETLYPSKKGLLILDTAIIDIDEPPPETKAIGFVDGSASDQRSDQLRPPVFDGPGIYDNSHCGNGTSHGRPVLHTVNGTAGRDIQ